MNSKQIAVLIFAYLTLPALAAEPAKNTQANIFEYHLNSDTLGGFASTRDGLVKPVKKDLSTYFSSRPDRNLSTSYAHQTPDGLIVQYSINDSLKGKATTAGITRAHEFSIATAYGQTMALPAGAPIPFGWGTIAGTPNSSKIVKYLLGAPYGAVESLNSALPIPGGWGRTSGASGGYGVFKYINGASYPSQEYLDSNWPIPTGWVRVSGSFGYGIYRYVANAPFATEVYADSTWPIPGGWVRINGATSGYGIYRNANGAPSGTQWTVDVRWPVPGGWTNVTNSYPYRIIRKL